MEVDGGGVHGNHDVDGADDDDDDGDVPLVSDQGEGDHVVVVVGDDVGGQGEDGEGGQGDHGGGEGVDDDESVVVVVYDDDGDVHAYPSRDNDGGILSLLVADQSTAQSVALVHYQLDYERS